MGEGHSAGPLPRARARLLRGTHDRGVESEKTDSPARRQYLFRLPGARVFLLAAVRESDWISIVTTRPSSSVAPAHDRMPLVLGPGKSSAWLGPEFAQLADRSSVALISALEQGDEGDELSQ